MTSSTIAKATRCVALLVASAMVAAGLAAASHHAEASPEQPRRGGGTGGVGLSIDIGPLIDGVRRQRERPRRPPPRIRGTDCPRYMAWSRRVGDCVCARGYVMYRGTCRPAERDVRPRPAPAPPPRPTPVPEPAADVMELQECLQEAGFDPGPIDGVSGPQTRRAWREFQRAHGLAGRPATLGDGQTLDALMEICEEPPEEEQVADAPLRSVAPVEASARCLPGDLHDLLAQTYGHAPAVDACPSVCLPKPVFYSEARLDEVAESHGVTWCNDCIQLGSWLPLGAVLAIEQAANVTLCASPTACFLPGRTAVENRGDIRTIFRTLPRSLREDSDIAVVLGNERYSHESLPDNPNGDSDASAVRTLLVEQLGFRDDNILDLRNATLDDMEGLFGSSSAESFELAERIGDDKQRDIFIYISSHGLTAEEEERAYLLPVDADLDAIETSAYPLQQLYENLGKIGARTVMVILEADFPGEVAELVDPPNLPEMSVDAMPIAPVPGLAVFKASDRDQRTLIDPEFGIGLFTRYLIEGLAGKADESPYGNEDKRIDAVELFVYTSDMVRMAARKSHGVEQKPLLSQIDNLLVGRLAQR